MSKLIEKWKKKSKAGKHGYLYYVHRNTNGDVEDLNSYHTPSGRNKKVKRLQKAYPSYKVVSKDADN